MSPPRALPSPRRSLGALSLFFCLGGALLARPGQALEPVSPEQPAAEAPAPAACALLLKELAWHEPFFGLSRWSDAARQALSSASPDCRAAIAAGQAPEVAAALRELEQHAAQEPPPPPPPKSAASPEALPRAKPQLLLFVYRLACQLRVPEARTLILAGAREPAVYMECADALFDMPWPKEDAAAKELRERYISGLRDEPIKTHLPKGVLRPPYAERLAPVLRAYDEKHRPGRDAIYHALCEQQMKPASAEVLEICSRTNEREPAWVAEQFGAGNEEHALEHAAALSPQQLPQLAELLRRLDAEKSKGRDRLYDLLCAKTVTDSEELRSTCRALLPREEPMWVARKRAKVLMTEVEGEHASFRRLLWLGLFGSVAMFVGALLYSVVFRRRR